MTPRLLASALALSFVAAGGVQADEGMWTFDNFPAAKVKATYGVDIDQAWLDTVQAASVRLTTGCSASIVSKTGLVLTNNHCVADCTQALSSPGKDYVKDGFLTGSREEELKCAGMQAEVLLTIVDVTDTVTAAGAGKTGQDFVKARDAAFATAELAACGNDKTLRCQTISFYRGGQYKVYKYRRYADVRLVFAPEYATAFFGGDPDNFNFPRFNLDSAFLRLYEDGKPVATPRFLKWRATPPVAGEPTFVAGNPGSTERQLTVSQLETQRDLTIPVSQLQRSELRGRLIQFGEQSVENKRIANQPLAGVENSYKVFFGRQFVLNDKAFLDAKRAQEDSLRAKVAADPKLAAQTGEAWNDIAAAQKAVAEKFLVLRQMDTAAGGGSELFGYARTLVRAATERAKPTAERLPEYGDTRLALVEKRLLDAKPVDAPLEQLYLEHWLLKTREYLTADAPQTKLLLGKESPESLSARLVAGSKLADPAARKALWDGGLAAVKASDDPMIQFVLAMDPAARDVRKDYETTVTSKVDAAAEKIAKARFAVLGDSVYPDATFSLRLSYGKVEGWTQRGRAITPFTTFAGFYDRATGAEPFEAAPRWIAAKDRLKLDTVYNYVTTNDIIGGNSGSPVIDAKAQVIGAAFDGNIHSLGGAYGYDGTMNRSVVVGTTAITEALTKVYGRDALVRELAGK